MIDRIASGAFCEETPLDRQDRTTGPLAGLTFGVKDLFDVAGLPTGAGSPDWRATHPVPTTTAPAVQALLDAGARLVGKTRTDELAWSLTGENHHYGTPRNAAASGRIPGGSSSGSASATAAGLVDVALGSDTGGSVRLPASFCGLYGLRTSHGRIPLAGAVPLAPSYDTVGWFARDPGLLARVGAVLLGDGPAPVPIRHLVIARDLFALVGTAVTEALRPALERIAAMLGPATAITVADGALPDWRETFRIVQSAEAWSVHGAWIERVRPMLGPGVRERFAAAAALDPAAVAAARASRTAIATRMRRLVPPGTAMLAPVAAGIAPRRDSPAAELDAMRATALTLLCPAGHAGLPEIALPVATLEGCPLGLGIIGAAGADEALLALAERLG